MLLPVAAAAVASASKMKASEIQPRKLVVFDIDDTLVHTQTKVHVVKDGEVVDSLNSHDFTHYRLKPGEEFDFSGFRNAREFFEKSKPIIPMMNQLKRDIATGNKVVMVTARADFDDKELFLDTFRKFGIDIDKVHVYRAGNSKQGTTEERKKAIIKDLLDKDDYSKAIMYDDAKPNLHTFMELKKDHPKTKFYAWHVSLEGEASEYMREGIMSERKKRRRKSRWAAYGPGPYGGYGYAVGYSGDGGSSGGDGGVGEASYPGNVGMMEVAKFFKVANEAQKKLFKELLEKGKRGLAWKLIQDVTGTELKGREFTEDRTADVEFSTGEKKRVRYVPTGKDIVDTLVKYYLRQGMKVVKVDDTKVNWNLATEQYSYDPVDEGWRDTLAGLALSAGVAMAGPASANVEKVVVGKGDTVYSIAKAFGTTPDTIQKLNKLDKDFSVKAGQTIKVPKWEEIKEPEKKKTAEKKPENKKLDASKTLTGKPYEALLTNAARSGGITDPVELAAFLAQCAVETGDFSKLREVGNRKYVERMYDIKHNPRGARVLGNTRAGDGWKYRGRGFIMLTGKYNYRKAGRDLGIDLVKSPDLLMKPDIAAKVSVWYWKERVRPKVSNFNDTEAITKLVQGGDKHLENREEAFLDFKDFKLATR